MPLSINLGMRLSGSGSGGGEPTKFTFNGVDQYGQFSDWAPLGLPFSISAKVTPTELNGTDQRVVSGKNSPSRGIRVNTTNSWDCAWVDIDGNVIPVAGPAAILGVEHYVEELTTQLDHALLVNDVSNNTAGLYAQADAINIIDVMGGSATYGIYSKFAMRNLQFTDMSAFQRPEGRPVIQGDQTVYIALPSIALVGDFVISIKWRRKDGTGINNQGLLSDPVSLRTALLAYDSGHVSEADTLQIKGATGISLNFQDALAGIAQGQDFKIHLTRVANQVTLEIDDVVIETKAKSIGDIAISLAGIAHNGVRPLKPNSPIGDIILSDSTQYVHYKIDEGYDRVIKAYDAAGNEEPTANAAILPARSTPTQYWVNPTSSFYAGWVDNGGGVYSTDGVTGFSYLDTILAATPAADVLYTITLDVTNYVSGVLTFIVGSTFYASSASFLPITGNGPITFNVLSVANINVMRILSEINDRFIGTVSNIEVITLDVSTWSNIPNNSRNYRMNEGQGTEFIDSIGGNNATIVNAGSPGGGWPGQF